MVLDDKSKQRTMCPDLLFDYQAYLDSDPLAKLQDIHALKDWLLDLDIKHNYIPKDISEKQLLVFYRACDYDLEATKKCITVYYGIRKKAPGYFNNRDVEEDQARQALDVIDICLVPHRTPDGYDVIVNRLRDFSPGNYNYEAVTRVFFMTLDRILYERGPCKGIIIIFDMKGVRFGHLFRATINQMRNYFTYVQEGIPIKIHQLHVLNAVSLFQTLVKILRPFARKELLDSIKIYGCNHDMEKFYEEVMPREFLPSDYGGTLSDVRTIHEENVKYLKEIKRYFDDEEAWRVKCVENGKI